MYIPLCVPLHVPKTIIYIVSLLHHQACVLCKESVPVSLLHIFIIWYKNDRLIIMSSHTRTTAYHTKQHPNSRNNIKSQQITTNHKESQKNTRNHIKSQQITWDHHIRTLQHFPDYHKRQINFQSFSIVCQTFTKVGDRSCIVEPKTGQVKR